MTDAVAMTGDKPELHASWVPMIVVALAQILMAFNVNALRVSIGGISLDTSPTTVGTAIVTHSLFIAGLVMLGAKIGAFCGPQTVFKATVLLFGAAMVMMALSPSAAIMMLAQGLAGVAAAALVPTLVVLIAASYQSRQQAQALGWLGASEAMGGVLAFLIAGFLGTWIGWRYSFGLLGILAAGVFLLCAQLSPAESARNLRIDAVGVVLAASAIILISTAAVLVSRLYGRLSLRHIARLAFVVVAAGLALLAVVIRNEWDTLMVILALIIIGLGQGALVTILFNALAAASPDELAGDVASLRGTNNNLAGAVGTAIAGALLIGVLSASITTSLVDNPAIPQELKAQIDLDNVDFVSDDRLLEVLEHTTAAPRQVPEAARIYTQAHQRSLRICLLALMGLALVAIFPAGALPGYSETRARPSPMSRDLEISNE